MSISLKKIAIKGAYGRGNFGDDMLMLATYKIVRKVFDSASIILICPESNFIRKMIPNAKLVSEIRYEEADIFIYGGGTQFYSFPLTNRKNARFLLRYIVNYLKNLDYLIKKIIYIFYKLLFPKKINTKVVAIGVGLGPFIDNSSRFFKSKKIFKAMDYIAVRDIQSYELCKEWACTNLYLRSDLCYLPDLLKEYVCNVGIKNKLEKLKRVGIIVRDWPHTNEGNCYAEPLFKVVDELRSVGKEVEFILFHQTSDKQWIKRLKDRHEPFIAWNPEHEDISCFITRLSTYDVFITARYHGAVFASILGKPVVCIEIEQKLRLVADLFGCGARLWRYPFNTLDCLEYIVDFEISYSNSVQCLDRVVEEQCALVEKMILELRCLF